MARTVAPKKMTVMTEGETADIFLYGVIGEDWMSAWDEQNTDKEFVKTFKELDGKYSRINLRINSPGGSMYDGNAMITTIRSAKSEVHAYNDGLCASMAADIWMACPNRHMATNALLMIHAPWSFAVGNAQEMRKQADILDKFADTAINVMAESTGMDKDEIKSTYYDGADHFLNYDDAKSFITTKKDAEVAGAAKPDEDEMPYQAAFELPQNIRSMNPLAIFSFFKNKMGDIVAPESNNVSQITPEMNLEDFKKSIIDGTLNKEAAMAFLNPTPEAAATTVPAEAPASEKPTEEQATPPQNDEFQKLTQMVATLTEKVETLSKSPAEARAAAALPTPENGVEMSADTPDDKEAAAFFAATQAAMQTGHAVVTIK